MLAPGQTIGQYKIIEKIGEGGMGAVFKAQQSGVNRLVVVKVLTADTSDDPEMLQRFRRELDIIARLEHPHILPVYDYGEIERQPYIVMRYMGGGSLLDRLRAGSLRRADILRLFDQIASALDYAHERSIIHRDLKPANVLLDDPHTANAYLADFGLAKTLETDSGLTKTGTLMGTPAYMSPEQARGDKLDARSDIYSLAIMAYEALSGRPPFRGETTWDLIRQQLTAEPPSILNHNPDLPPEVDDVLAAALAKDPDARPGKASLLVQGLREALARAPERTGAAASLPGRPAPQTVLTAATKPEAARPASQLHSIPPTPSLRAQAKSTVILPQAAAVAIPAAIVGLIVLGLAVIGAAAVGAYVFRDSLFGPAAAAYAVGDSPRAAAAAGDSIWVANGFGNTVVRLRADCAESPDLCGQSLGAYPVDDLPVSVAAHGDSIWVASALHSRLTELDADTGEQRRQVDLPDVPSAMIIAHEAIWIANQFADSVTKVDLQGSIVSEAAVSGGPAALAANGAGVWVAAASGQTLTRLDPATGQVAATLALDGSPAGLAASDALVWAAVPERNEVLAIDPQAASVAQRLSVEGGPTALLYDGESIWSANPGNNTLARIDPAAFTVVSTVTLNARPYTLAWSACGGACRDVWVVSEATDAVLRIRFP